MQLLNCLIVEDEPLASRLINEYIMQVPGLKVNAICTDVFSAADHLKLGTTDIIFLDINLPKMNGLEFIRTLTKKPHVILTTAYHQYAIEGFNLNVVDYLLKPIEFSRFLQAVNKVFEQTKITSLVSTRKIHYFNVDKKKVKVFADEILLVESIKDYVKIQTAEKTIVTKFNLSDLESVLDSSFLRIHKSYIINCNCITAFNATSVEIGKFTIPIGRTYKETVENRLATVLPFSS